MNSKFLGTSTIDDILEVRSIFKSIEGVRLKIDQDIFKDEKKLFSANIEFALLNKNAKPIKLCKLLPTAVIAEKASGPIIGRIISFP